MNQMQKHARRVEKLVTERDAINKRLQDGLSFMVDRGRRVAEVQDDGKTVQLSCLYLSAEDARRLGEWLIAITHDPEPPLEIAGQDVGRA